MKENELKEGTKKFALRVIKVVEGLPKTISGYEFGKQLFRCGTSVNANIHQINHYDKIKG